MNILCKNWDVTLTLATFYYVLNLWKIFMGNKSQYFLCLKKLSTHACLIVMLIYI